MITHQTHRTSSRYQFGCSHQRNAIRKLVRQFWEMLRPRPLSPTSAVHYESRTCTSREASAGCRRLLTESDAVIIRVYRPQGRADWGADWGQPRSGDMEDDSRHPTKSRRDERRLSIYVFCRPSGLGNRVYSIPPGYSTCDLHQVRTQRRTDSGIGVGLSDGPASLGGEPTEESRRCLRGIRVPGIRISQIASNNQRGTQVHRPIQASYPGNDRS